MEISPFLSSLLHAKFNTTHMRDENLEKAYFCVDCGGNSLSKKEMETNHKEHRVFRSRKNTRDYCYRRIDILSLGSEVLDVTGVCVYNINSTDVYYIKSRKPVENLHLRGNPGSCFTCGSLVIKPALFCSLLCRVECKEDPNELGTMRRIMEQENVGLSLKKKKKSNKKRKRGERKTGGEMGNKRKRVENEVKSIDMKRSRKGVPKRAPFF